VLVPRALLVTLLVVGAVLAGPGVVRTVGEAFASHSEGTTIPVGDVGGLLSDGAPVPTPAAAGPVEQAVIQPAATAPEEPLGEAPYGPPSR
jgi:hypothetical protein